MAVNGVSINLVTFMRVVMQLDNANAAKHVSNWSGTTYVFSIVGAIIADSYWGRYKSCIIFQLIFLAGLVELSISSYFFLHNFSCKSESGDTKTCRTPSAAEIAIFYAAIYKIALGNGAYQPTNTTFGADQFDEEHTREKRSKTAFYGYFFVANNLGSLVAVTFLTYMEDQGSWAAAFVISAAAALLGLLLFAAGTKRFRHFMPCGNPAATVGNVFVAATKKRHLTIPAQVEKLYELDGTHSVNGGKKIAHTPGYRFLDKAAVIEDPSILLPGEQPASRPRRLYTVTQVEQVKCILRLIPIWLCSIIYSTTYSQMSSVFIEQAQAMDNTLNKLTIPAAGIGIFEIIGVTSFVFIYTFCIAKPLSRRSKEPTELQRMGIGLVISTAAMIAAALVERQRLKHAERYRLSVLWQIPQYLLIGASEVFIRSGGQAGWIPQNLNQGHVDRFFFLIAALNAADLALFVLLAKRYRGVAKPAAAAVAAVGPINKTICPNDVVVVSPDVGGVARARAFAKKLSDAPLAIVDKRRLGHNQAEVMNLIGDVRGKVAVMVDDMIDTAGTMHKGAELLHREGARAVYACSTHAVLSPPAVERLSGGLFQEVIITNTVPVPPDQRFPQLTVLSVANLLGETIWRVHDDCSVSSIFQ
ncbi:unnamed protein product [Triticum turgidum subsp. durum]|uniref:ribose-phosphate diphosphokinase n=1 Tax=Triticum turgidum subsp. durum TaxID=4567 RepID=A0A9R0TFP3_TRITD|nr:unnamed protein product [Triticum turgidum subsp. durum]